MLGPAPASGLRSFRQTLSSHRRPRPLVGAKDPVPRRGRVDFGLDRGEEPRRRLGRRREAEERRRERLDLRRGGAIRPGARQRAGAAEAEPVQGVTPAGHCNAFRSAIRPRRTQVFDVPTGTFRARATSS